MNDYIRVWNECQGAKSSSELRRNQSTFRMSLGVDCRTFSLDATSLADRPNKRVVRFPIDEASLQVFANDIDLNDRTTDACVPQSINTKDNVSRLVLGIDFD